MPPNPIGLYADAHIYDILHDTGSGKQSLAEAKLLVRIASLAGAGSAKPALPAAGLAHQRPRLRCYEPACGSGRVVIALARLGHTCVGSDIDPAMVRYANARAKSLGLGNRAKAVVGAMDEAPKGVPQGTIDLALNPINSIRHLPTDASMLRHLRCVRSLLAPQGVYIVGLSLSMVGHEEPSEDVWKGSRDGIRVTQVVQYEPPTGTEKGPWSRRERVMSHLTVRSKAAKPSDATRTRKAPSAATTEDHRDSTYWLRTYSREQWLTLVSRAGLHVRSTHSTDGVSCEASELGYFWFTLSATTG
jgi:SAM-dependent methyltransferase